MKNHPRLSTFPIFAIAIQFTSISCASNPSGVESVEQTAAPQVEPRPAAARAKMTAEECRAAGGRVIGDIGDGRIHRPGYLCPETGEAPIGTVVPDRSQPIAIEGSVCCQPPD